MNFSLENSRLVALVLDLQELFTSATGPFNNAASGSLIDNVNVLLSALRKKQVPVVFSSYVLADDLSDAGLLKENPIVKQGYFSAGSSWMKWDKRLHIETPDILLSRNRPTRVFRRRSGGTAGIPQHRCVVAMRPEREQRRQQHSQRCLRPGHAGNCRQGLYRGGALGTTHGYLFRGPGRLDRAGIDQRGIAGKNIVQQSYWIVTDTVNTPSP